MTVITKTVHARAGLIGNPSDGYNGKTIAFLVKNFAAQVTLWESPKLEIQLSQQDLCKFKGIEELVEDTKKNGYYGGLRLVRSAIKRFYEHITLNGQEPQRKTFENKFTISYSTNVPRQVGLAGSSAIVTATFRALMDFYSVHIDPAILANLVLETETKELGITAGLQDRVVQSFGGMIYMDFSKEAFERNKNEHGLYIPMSPNLLPEMFLVYDTHPSESGKIHSDVRYRYKKGDKDVIQAMQTFADFTEKAREALNSKDHKTLAELMNQNFDLRRKIFGGKAIGERYLQMIELARECGCCAKFSGSGGAVIGMYESPEQYTQLEKTFKENGYRLLKIEK